MALKTSNIVRALLVLTAISAPAGAQNFSSGNNLPPNSSGPITIESPNTSPGIGPGQNTGQGFSGFVDEVRDAVRTPRSIPLPRQADGPSSAAPDSRPQLPDPTYDSTLPMTLGQGSASGNAAEIFLGVSVKQIVKEIPPPSPVIGEGPAPTEKSSGGSGKIIGSAGGGGGSPGTGGNWLGGGFLSAEGSGGGSGFGFDLRPMAFPTDLGDPNYRGPGRSEEEVSKSLKRLRRIVLDLVFNPFVYFGCLFISVLMFMARFRTG